VGPPRTVHQELSTKNSTKNSQSRGCCARAATKSRVRCRHRRVVSSEDIAGYRRVVAAEARQPIERELRERLEALIPAAQAELLRVLRMTPEERARQIKLLYEVPLLRVLAEFLIDLEDDLLAQAMVMRELRFMEWDTAHGRKARPRS
jgi:hypothetical protein